MASKTDRPGGGWRDIAGAVAETLLRPREGKKTARPADRALTPLPGDPIGGAWASPRPVGFGGLMPPEESAGRSPAGTSDDRRSEAVEGVPVMTSPPAPKPRPPEPPRSARPEPRRGPAAWLAGRPQDSRLDQLRATAAAPELGTTMAQRVATEEAGRAAVKGDALGLRLALADLVQKMDLSSPKDSAALVPQALGQYGVGALTGVLNQGRMTLEMTQGGQLFRQVAPLLKRFSNVDISGELDTAWNGMSERFAKTATGTVDLVLPSDGPKAGGATPAAGAAERAGKSEAPAGRGGGSGAAGGRPLVMRELEGPAADLDRVDVERPRAGGLSGLREVDSPAHGDAAEQVDVSDGESAGGLSMREVTAPGAAESTQDVDLKGAGDRGRLRVKEDGGTSPDRASVRVGATPSGGLTVREAPAAAEAVARANPKVAGGLTLRELLTANPAITAVNLREVPTPGGAAGGGATTVTRDVLLQLLGGR